MRTNCPTSIAPVEELARKIEQTKEESELVRFELKKVLEEAEKTLLNFEKHYDSTVIVLSRDIPLLDRSIEEKAVKKLDDFLQNNFASVLWEMRTWPREEFEPFLKETIRDEVEDSV